MKLITFLLLVIAVNCKGQIVDTTKPLHHYGTMKRQPAIDTIPLNFKAMATFKADKLSLSTWPANGTYYDVMITSPEKGLVAYKKKDSAWVIKDTAETLRQALWYLEQQAKGYSKH